MSVNYKMCPLKKRPVIYKEEEDQEFQDQPQDLSLKRKGDSDWYNEVVSEKRNFALNLSTNSFYDKIRTSNNSYARPESPDSVNSSHESLPTITPTATVSFQQDYSRSPPSQYSIVYPENHNIHLRGMENTTNSFRSAFVNAAAAAATTTPAGVFTPMTALWDVYNHKHSIASGIFPSPTSSVASLSPARSIYNYQPTPPSSPNTDSEPEDLTTTYDIPLPALYHDFGEYTKTTNYHATMISSPSAKSNSRHKCENCGKMYSTSLGLSKHQKFHCLTSEVNQEKKLHSCHLCGKLYTTVGALKMHVRTHTLPCKCNICGKAFSRPWLLQGHIRTHTGEKPFKCGDCNRSFADRSNLRAHQQTHVDVKKYVCGTCKKSFSRMSLLNKHANSGCTITVVKGFHKLENDH